VSSNQTVGVIFKTERDSFRVLDQNGQVRLVQPHQISMRRDSNRAIATDAEGHELRVGDNMKENDGEVRVFLSFYEVSAVLISVVTLFVGSEGSRAPRAPILLCVPA
jgi:transcription elongation factor